MVINRTCPHTGVMNFFISANPYVAVGSIRRTVQPERYAWFCYLGDEASGMATNLSSATSSLRRAIADRRITHRHYT
jgi:hypothetical protein